MLLGKFLSSISRGCSVLLFPVWWTYPRKVNLVASSRVSNMREMVPHTWRREWQPLPVFLPGESHGQRSLMGYSPWARKESDTTEWQTHTHAHTHTQAICSCYSLCLETFGSSLGPRCPETVSGPLTWLSSQDPFSRHLISLFLPALDLKLSESRGCVQLPPSSLAPKRMPGTQ